MKHYYNNLSNKNFVLYLLIVSFIIKILFLSAFGEFKNPNMVEHGWIAECLIKGGYYSMHWDYRVLSEERMEEQKKLPPYKGAWIPPVNPFLLYLFLKILGFNSLAYFLFGLFNVVLSCLSVFIVYLISKEFLSEKTARVSAIFSLIYLPNTYTVITFSGGPVYHFLTLLTIWLLIRNLKEPRVKELVFFGIVSALMCLTRSEFIGLFVIYSIILLFFYKSKYPKYFVKYSFLIGISFIIIFFPWAIRNTIVFGKVVPVVSHPWHEIWRGNNPMATGGNISTNGKSVWLGRDSSHYDLIRKIDKVPLNNQFELVVDSLFKEEVLKFWRNDPIKAIAIMGKRVIYFWTTDLTEPKATDIKYAFFVYVALIPFLFGLFYLLNNRKNKLVLYSIVAFVPFFIYYTAIVGVINLTTRYQVYLFSTFMPLTGIGYYVLKNKFFKKNEKILIFEND